MLEAEIAELRAANAELKAQLVELDKLCTLQEADLARARAEQARELPPNRPERVPANTLQLAFFDVVKTLVAPANDADDAHATERSGDDESTPPPPAKNRSNKKKKKRSQHGRRQPSLEGLPVINEVLDPAEVTAAGGRGFIKIGEEISERVAYRRSSWVALRFVMTKWAKVDEQPRRIVRAELPPSVWPRTMADPSAIAELILAKYDMSLPLHRQERASPRLGFYLPRSTQCGWLSEAHGYLYRIVDAMMSDACTTAHCIATDATSAPIRQLGECGSWHLFVFIADQDHVVFRAVPEHTSAAIEGLLKGFKGRLSPPGTKGSTFTGITGSQGPAR